MSDGDLNKAGRRGCAEVATRDRETTINAVANENILSEPRALAAGHPAPTAHSSSFVKTAHRLSDILSFASKVINS
jgi:hypothetical protein